MRCNSLIFWPYIRLFRGRFGASEYRRGQGDSLCCNATRKSAHSFAMNLGRALFVASCVTFSFSAEALARPEPPPRGLLDYCSHNANVCGVSPSAAPAEQTAPANRAERQDAQRREWFRVLLHSPSEQPEITRPELTDELWRQLIDVNRAVNAAIVEDTDQNVYGLTEFWATPLSAPTMNFGAIPRGDCEDYVLEKRLRLMALGWTADSLSIAMAYAPYRGLHVVLIAHVDKGDFVLDNASDEPEPFALVPYQWLSHQVGANLLAWESFDDARASPPSDQPSGADAGSARQ